MKRNRKYITPYTEVIKAMLSQELAFDANASEGTKGNLGKPELWDSEEYQDDTPESVWDE